jgi:uncharacterized protein
MAFDQLVVSVDGDEVSHDLRRGLGTYKIMKDNISRYQNIVSDKKDKCAELSLACVMSNHDINSPLGNSVQQLGDSLGVKRVRFRPLLPIGRAIEMEEEIVPEALHSHIDPIEIIKNGISPKYFKDLSTYNIDTIEKCRECDYRYLCGGACRAWSGEKNQYHLDAPPTDCSGLKNRAKEIVEAAREYLLNDDI